MWRLPRPVAAGSVRRERPRLRFRTAVLFHLPWRHPFLRAGDVGIRSIKHFNTCECDEMSAVSGGPTGSYAARICVWVRKGRSPWCTSRC